MENIKEINYKDYIPNEVKLSETNKLLICQNFGFVYEFVDIITPVGHGSVDIIFDIFYRDVYEKPEALVPRDEYKGIFFEFKEWFLMTHFNGDSLPFIILEKDDFIFIDELQQDPFKLMLPKGTLIFKGNYYNLTVDLIKAFWSWNRYKPGTNQKEFCGYSKTKEIFIKENNGEH